MKKTIRIENYGEWLEMASIGIGTKCYKIDILCYTKIDNSWGNGINYVEFENILTISPVLPSISSLFHTLPDI